MNKISNIIMIAVCMAFSGWAGEVLTGSQIAEKMDVNQNFKSAEMESTMIIYIDGEKRIKNMKSFTIDDKGETKAYTEFINAEDKGTKYLMIGDELWIYFPEEEDVMKISGHMLKKGMMGSDVSYEDALNNDKLSDKYDIKLLGEEKVSDKVCYVIDLNAKVKKVPYYRRKIWVDKENFVAMKEEMYAKSGKILKTSKTNKVEKINGLWLATESELSDKVRKNSKTEFIMKEIKLNVDLDKSLFTMRNLRR